jgi:hypothetical protein
MLAPQEIRKPTKDDLGSIRDVVEAIKQYRLKTRFAYDVARKTAGAGRTTPFEAQHFHWTGRLEVVTRKTMARYHSSEYWR